jgi:hypothetical protein
MTNDEIRMTNDLTIAFVIGPSCFVILSSVDFRHSTFASE